MISVPNFIELSAKKIWQEVRFNPLYKEYLPDFDDVVPPRQYLFNVSLAHLMTDDYSIDCEHP